MGAPSSASCDACRLFADALRIERPSDLTRVAARVRDAIAAGTLIVATDIPVNPTVSPQSSIDDVARGVWSDVVEHHFRCPKCRRSFTLTAETYHGSGGEWRVD